MERVSLGEFNIHYVNKKLLALLSHYLLSLSLYFFIISQVLDDMPMLLTADEANHIASLLADKTSFVKVHYLGLVNYSN